MFRKPLPPAAVVDAVLRLHDVTVADGQNETVLLRLHGSAEHVRPNTLTSMPVITGSIQIGNAVIHYGPDAIDPVVDLAHIMAPEPDAPMQPPSPPRRAHQVLCLIYSPERLEDVAGTMEELFYAVAEKHGRGFAKAWFWWQVAGCILGRARALLASATELVGLKRT